MRWEYLIERLSDTALHGARARWQWDNPAFRGWNLEDVLRYRGLDEWELVQVVLYENSHQYIFKRPAVTDQRPSSKLEDAGNMDEPSS